MKKLSIVASLLAFPVLASADTINNVWNIFGFVKKVLDTVLPLIIALAVVYFIYGIFKYVMAGDDDAKAAAKDKIIYGVVGLFIMISVWGLVNILSNTFQLDNRNRGNDAVEQLRGINVPNLQ